MNLAEIFDSFARRVHRTLGDVRVARVSCSGGSAERVLVAPAERMRDDLTDAQRARQRDAGALPPEVYGVELLELLPGPRARLWDGSLVPLPDDASADALLARFLDPSTPEGRRLERAAAQIRDGLAASRRVFASMRKP